MAVEEESGVDPAVYHAMLATVRRRRWYLYGLILIYLPATAISLKLSESVKPTGILFVVWLIMLITAVALLACCKCPRCGNNFHLRNSNISYFGRCRHCDLDIRDNRSQ